MWSSALSTVPASGLHSCLSKSDWSCCLAFSASTRNSCRVLKINLQRSQYAMLGVLPMSRAILRIRSGIETSLQGRVAESNAATGMAPSRGPAELATAPRGSKKSSRKQASRSSNCCTVLLTAVANREGEKETCRENFPPLDPVDGYGTRQLPRNALNGN
jgi:hypothetical protein